MVCVGDAARVSPSPRPRCKKSGGIQAYFLYGSDISAVRQQVAGVIEKKTIYFKRSSLVKRWLKYTVRIEDCSYLRCIDVVEPHRPLLHQSLELPPSVVMVQ